MKKTINIIILCMALLPAVSCNGWLEAVSSKQIQADKLFETKSGYYEALSGIYIELGSSSAYGQNMTMLIPDLIAYPTVTSDHPIYRNWQIHEYETETVRTAVDATWLQCYRVIANINLMLEKLEEHRDLFSEELEYKLFRGECLGLRAYIHFDLMRLFGTAHWDGENASKVTVPYVTVYTKDAQPQRSYSETSKMLLQDIEEAISLMAEDPICTKMSSTFQNGANAEGFWEGRQKHMNVIAANALAARVHQWMGETGKAAEYASTAAGTALGTNAASWYNADANIAVHGYGGRDMTMSSEHLFSLEVPGLYTNADMFMQEQAGVSSGLRLDISFVDNTLFPTVDIHGSMAGREDARGPIMSLSYTSAGYNNYKFYGSASSSARYRNRMPMLKLSEMYYIMAENHIAQKDTAAAFSCLNTIRSHRGISDELNQTDDVFTELTKEYYREFYGEGQLLYWIKHTDMRGNLASFGILNLMEDKLTLPYPIDETSYGRKQEL